MKEEVAYWQNLATSKTSSVVKDEPSKRVQTRSCAVKRPAEEDDFQNVPNQKRKYTRRQPINPKAKLEKINEIDYHITIRTDGLWLKVQPNTMEKLQTMNNYASKVKEIFIVYSPDVKTTSVVTLQDISDLLDWYSTTNDAMIGFVDLLKDQYKAQPSFALIKDSYIILHPNCAYFFNNKEDDYEGKDEYIIKPFEQAFKDGKSVIIPYLISDGSENGHWVLMVYKFSALKWYYYNSMRSPIKSQPDRFFNKGPKTIILELEHVALELQRKDGLDIDLTPNNVVFVKTNIQQPGSVNCAIHVYMYIKSLLSEEFKSGMTSSLSLEFDIGALRLELVESLLNHPHKSWKEEDYLTAQKLKETIS